MCAPGSTAYEEKTEKPFKHGGSSSVREVRVLLPESCITHCQSGTGPHPTCSNESNKSKRQMEK